MHSALFIAAISYLLGSIPFGYLLVRIFHGEDVRRTGSGNIGATNVSRKSPALGVLTLLLDALKGSAAVAISIRWNPHVLAGDLSQLSWKALLPASSPELILYAAIAALCAVVGHIFPIWLKFRGGKGVATGLGAFAMIAPKPVLLSVGVFFAVVFVFRYVSLGSIVAVAAFPNLTLALHEYGDNALALVLIALASVLIIVKHHANIRRLLTGTEPRISVRQAVNQGNQ